MWRHVCCWSDDDARGYGGGDDGVSYQDRLPQPPAPPGPTSSRVPVGLAPEAGLVPRCKPKLPSGQVPIRIKYPNTLLQ